jgi:site-specific DNA-methyltransferase (adenine-specific)
MFKSQTVEWPTPAAVYQALDEEFHFDFDPCPLGGSENGLATLFCSWVGKRVFCNPPYGPGLRDWLERGLDADLAVYLIPARTDTRWFHEVVLPRASEIRFIKGRLKFGGATENAPFPSMIVVFRAGQKRAQSDNDRPQLNPPVLQN